MPEDISEIRFLFHSRKLFSKSPPKIFVTSLRDIIGLEKFILSFSQS